MRFIRARQRRPGPLRALRRRADHEQLHVPPYLDGASESCPLTVPSTATAVYVMVRGFTAASCALSITRTPNQHATWSPLPVLAGTTLTVTMSGTGDPDLYVRFGAAPTTTAFDCRLYINGASETCSAVVPSRRGRRPERIKWAFPLSTGLANRARTSFSPRAARIPAGRTSTRCRRERSTWSTRATGSRLRR